MVTLIPYERFKRLRLADFLPHDMVEEFEWEVLDQRLVGEQFESTEFFRLEAAPESLVDLIVYLNELPPGVGQTILSALGLPLTAGLTDREVLERMGTPIQTRRRKSGHTYEFKTDGPEPYIVFCAIPQNSGLSAVGVNPASSSLTRPDVAN